MLIYSLLSLTLLSGIYWALGYFPVPEQAGRETKTTEQKKRESKNEMKQGEQTEEVEV